jgi:hypothetical protein
MGAAGLDTERTVLPPPGGGTVRPAGDMTDEEFQLPGGVSIFASVPDFAYVPRDARNQIASGAGGRFALAGAKCERRLPDRYGPAPEVPNGFARRRVSPSREGGSGGRGRERRLPFRPAHATGTGGYR